MTGIIDVGGGLRGIYGAGVFDRCLADGLRFDCCIGVSAGSANVAAFLGGQKGRNYRFFAEYAQRPEYMGWRNVVQKGAFIDLNYVYATLSNADGEDPLRYDRIAAYDGQMIVVASGTDGNPVYFTAADMAQNDYRIIRASSSLPVICGGCTIGGKTYFDGGIADPIPIEKAYAMGCDRVVLILTRPVDFAVSDGIDRIGAAALRKRHPALSQTLLSKAEHYRESLDFALKKEKEGKCLIVAPDDCCGVEMLTRETDKLRALYEKGVADGGSIRAFLQAETI
ncbi:MAG: patatin family protein [Clostridia bacterium]|nr:patatin family protein [Clostridia bacterium]